MTRARYIMIGGFLGAGKTTAISRLARWLTDQGLRVGLITNDQGRDLVDTAMLRSQGFATEEIPGGCFCCRFNSLVEAAGKLNEQTRPEVFLAEPVGSCTDLIATVTYPLRRLYGDRFTVAPVSVLVDPLRALRVFGVEKGPTFSEKVLYIYQKQIEEADLVVVSKSDTIPAEKLELLRTVIQERFPKKEILSVSSRTGANLEVWFNRVMEAEQDSGRAMSIDYDIYADGEALLGWLNSTVQLSAAEPVDSEGVLKNLALAMQARLRDRDAEIAHLKMTLSPDVSLAGEIAVINLVRSDFVPEQSLRLDDPISSGQLILNLRAEADPDFLAAALRESLSEVASGTAGLQLTLEHLEHFRPGKPMPTHRVVELT